MRKPFPVYAAGVGAVCTPEEAGEEIPFVDC
jgi:hypothetical protein